METNFIPVTLITGYLGSGKTTLLNRILRNKEGMKVAVIVNDLGQVNIDEEFLEGEEIRRDETSKDIVSLQNGCICCSLNADLINQINGILSTGKFDHIVIEASGVSEPSSIASTVYNMQFSPVENAEGKVAPRVNSIVAVVDALRMHSEFGNGVALRSDELEESDIENLVIQQIEFCSIIILNKISEISKEDVVELRETVRTLQPHAEIFEANHCNVDTKQILDAPPCNLPAIAESASWIRELEKPAPIIPASVGSIMMSRVPQRPGSPKGTAQSNAHRKTEEEKYGISTVMFISRKPMDFFRFDQFLQNLPKGIIRAKGITYFSHHTAMSVMIDISGSSIEMREAGYWFAEAPVEEQERVKADSQRIADEWDSEYGDRITKLVFIGKHLNQEALKTTLEDCLA